MIPEILDSTQTNIAKINAKSVTALLITVE
jgi:hypothetical protein